MPNILEEFFYANPSLYAITKLSNDTSQCDYGFIKLDSEIGQLLYELINNDANIQYADLYPPGGKIGDGFNKWRDAREKEGKTVISWYDEDGLHAIAYTTDELKKLGYNFD